MNSLEKMVVAKQIKNITYDDMIRILKCLKNTFTTVNGLTYRHDC
jgi:hypothetical protein